MTHVIKVLRPIAPDRYLARTRSPGLRIRLLPALPGRIASGFAGFVPVYSCGAAPASDRLPLDPGVHCERTY